MESHNTSEIHLVSKVELPKPDAEAILPRASFNITQDASPPSLNQVPYAETQKIDIVDSLQLDYKRVVDSFGEQAEELVQLPSTPKMEPTTFKRLDTMQLRSEIVNGNRGRLQSVEIFQIPKAVGLLESSHPHQRANSDNILSQRYVSCTGIQQPIPAYVPVKQSALQSPNTISKAREPPVSYDRRGIVHFQLPFTRSCSVFESVLVVTHCLISLTPIKDTLLALNLEGKDRKSIELVTHFVDLTKELWSQDHGAIIPNHFIEYIAHDQQNLIQIPSRQVESIYEELLGALEHELSYVSAQAAKICSGIFRSFVEAMYKCGHCEAASSNIFPRFFFTITDFTETNISESILQSFCEAEHACDECESSQVTRVVKFKSGPKYLVLQVSDPAASFSSRNVPIQISIQRKHDKWRYQLSSLIEISPDGVYNAYSMRYGTFYRFSHKKAKKVTVQKVLGAKP